MRFESLDRKCAWRRTIWRMPDLPIRVLCGLVRLNALPSLPNEEHVYFMSSCTFVTYLTGGSHPHRQRSFNAASVSPHIIKQPAELLGVAREKAQPVQELLAPCTTDYTVKFLQDNAYGNEHFMPNCRFHEAFLPYEGTYTDVWTLIV